MIPTNPDELVKSAQAKVIPRVESLLQIMMKTIYTVWQVEAQQEFCQITGGDLSDEQWVRQFVPTEWDEKFKDRRNWVFNTLTMLYNSGLDPVDHWPEIKVNVELAIPRPE